MKKPKLNLPVVQTAPEYEVGYGKPPKDTRFKRGQSGNPRGRPKGAKNRKPALNEERLKDIILEEAYRSITVRDGHRNVSVPMVQAVVRSMAVNAAKGQHRAQRLFAEMLSSTERQNRALSDEWLKTAIEYKVEWERELHRRETLGITDLPPPSPHPDQVKIDMRTGLAHIEGPCTKEEIEEVEMWRKRREGFAEDREFTRAALRRARNPERIAWLEEEQLRSERMLAMIDKLLDQIDWKGAGEG